MDGALVVDDDDVAPRLALAAIRARREAADRAGDRAAARRQGVELVVIAVRVPAAAGVRRCAGILDGGRRARRLGACGSLGDVVATHAGAVLAARQQDPDLAPGAAGGLAARTERERAHLDQVRLLAGPHGDGSERP